MCARAHGKSPRHPTHKAPSTYHCGFRPLAYCSSALHRAHRWRAGLLGSWYRSAIGLLYFTITCDTTPRGASDVCRRAYAAPRSNIMAAKMPRITTIMSHSSGGETCHASLFVFLLIVTRGFELEQCIWTGLQSAHVSSRGKDSATLARVHMNANTNRNRHFQRTLFSFGAVTYFALVLIFGGE